jgi:hypothetical protein
MNDNDMITRDLIATVREPFAGVRMGAPVDAVVTRGQAIRRRRRVQAITGAAAAVAAAAVLAAVAALPSGRLAAVNLTAWTVITEPTGTVAVTIRDLRDPAGLQRALRAHGVPATVRFDPPGSSMPSCITSVPSRLATIESRVFVQPPAASHGRYLLFIDPAAVPRTDKIAIDAVRGNGFSIGLVTQDGHCPPGSRPGGVGMKSTRPGHP